MGGAATMDQAAHADVTTAVKQGWSLDGDTKVCGPACGAPFACQAEP